MSNKSGIRPIILGLAKIPEKLSLGSATKCAFAAGRALLRRKEKAAVERRNAFLDLQQARAWHQKYLDAHAASGGRTNLRPIDIAFYEDRHRHLAMRQKVIKMAS